MGSTVRRRGSPALLIVVLLVLGGLIGYWFARPGTVGTGSPAVGTSGSLSPEESSARAKGREVGEKIAVATEKVRESVDEAALTTKIKAKMALDDSVKARAIDVSTSGTTVTLTGNVRSQAERERALALARETNGITQVVDRLTVQK